MAWTITARRGTGRVHWTGPAWTADPATTAALDARPGGPFGPSLLTPVGPEYAPTGPGDETALFLNAVDVLKPVTVTGDVPELPELPPVPDGAVS